VGNSRCDSLSSSGEPDLSRAHLAHQHQQHRDETLRPVVCATLSAVRACRRSATSQMTGSRNRLSAARRWRSLLRRPTPGTTSETHAWLTALEQQALAQSLPACSGALFRATSLSWRSAKR
jgi:hypothetical protein